MLRRPRGARFVCQTSTHFEELAVSPSINDARPLFTVVIASLCDDARSALLKRACDSVRAMAGDLHYSIIVVANGNRVSASVLDWLATRSDVRMLRLRSGSHPLARRVGAELADSEFLGFLDDDDELMPNTLAAKVALFRQHPEIDVVVTDGLRVTDSTVTKIFPPPQARSADLIETMMRTGWGACALTLRMQRIDLAAFDAEFRHLEWTLTTLELARRYKFGFLDEPTYRYNETTPDSLSKKAEHNLAGPEVWRRLSKSYAGTIYESAVRRRYGIMCHNVASECARHGKLQAAWRYHAKSLRSPRGLVFVPFTARLLIASLRRLFVRDGSRSLSAGASR